VTITLYYSPGACSLAPHIVLEELGIDYELELVSVSDGKTESPEYLRINPKGRVPALYFGEPILTEAPAILLYLGAYNVKMDLLPVDPNGLSRCVEWFNWLSGTVHSVAFGQLWRPQRFTDDQSDYSAISSKGKENIIDTFSVIEEKFMEKSWAVNEKYSVVDPYVLVFFRWGNRIGLDMRKNYPNWTRHVMRVMERPAVLRALEQEQISIWE
jgi:glutathione S-transferase